MTTTEQLPNYSITNAGMKSLERWDRAINSLREARTRVTSAECELFNAIVELGKFMTPKDAKTGEQFNLAVGDGFLSVTSLGQNNFKIEWRNPPSARR